ncbi:hypothetical protein RHMOL_Rhmol05G0292500 [Rhododendron molle]|uniref:Uncharacterized protein n=1 Tax=Rhododendron molle TaxID=49168 RepID=A0ACC0NWK2_RHOML|nr:hypothetical protein RHMOL_Rhmol05G0292500 [Rhododendron molle]
MGSEEDVAAAEVKAKNAGRRQNEKLYDAAGILNTKLMRAGKKRRKRANKSSGDAMEDDEDYDFKVDYVKKGSGTVDVTTPQGVPGLVAVPRPPVEAPGFLAQVCHAFNFLYIRSVCTF